MRGKELGHVNVVAALDASAQPLGVADHNVEAGALRRKLREGLGLEIRPRRGLDDHFHTAFLGVHVGEFLKLVGRIPLGPEDGERLRLQGAGEYQRQQR